MLGKVVKESQEDWDVQLPHVLAAYRASVHSSTGFTPNRLFLGRENRAPLDLVMNPPADASYNGQTVDDFVEKQQEIARESYQQVREHLRTNAERRKIAYDTHVRPREFEIGTWVWYHYPRRYQGRSPKWQRNFTGPYLIVRQIPPVNYVLQRTRASKPFVTHVDKLRKCFSETPVSWIPMTLNQQQPGQNLQEGSLAEIRNERVERRNVVHKEPAEVCRAARTQQKAASSQTRQC